MNNNKTDQTVHAYLNSIDSGPLLTRAQEEQLIKKVEVFQKDILSQLVLTNYSKNELKTYLQSLDSSEESIVDISKKLDDESTKAQNLEVETNFKALIASLDGSDSSAINILMDQVSLTGTIIHGVVTEIKKKHTAIQDVESKIKHVAKYFVGMDVVSIISDKENDHIVQERLRFYGLTGIKADNKLNEWKQAVEAYNQVMKTLPVDVSLQEIKDICKNISKLEFQASSFKNELITKNLRLVVSRAKRFLNKGLEFEDLIQEGNIGLMKAVDKFDSSKKTKVSTYATWWIDQSIRRAISNKGKTVRVPTHIEWMQTILGQVSQKLTGKLKRPPTLKELSDESGIELKVLEDLHTRASHEIGIDEELPSGYALIDVLPDPNSNPFSEVEQKLMREKMRAILATLPPRTEKIIRLRFGIGEIPDDEGMTLQQIANEEGITKQGVRVRECSGLKLLERKTRSLVNE